jgi:hypothetical protein
MVYFGYFLEELLEQKSFYFVEGIVYLVEDLL